MIAKLKRQVERLEAEVKRLKPQSSMGSRLSQTTSGTQRHGINQPPRTPTTTTNIPRWG